MRMRHRTPTIFSLSMLDVLCCGLGAVILLMILNFWDARRQAVWLSQARERVGQTALQLSDTESARDRARAELDQVRADLDRASASLRQTQGDLKANQLAGDQLRAKMTAMEKAAANTLASYTQLQREYLQKQKELAAKTEEFATAQADLAAAMARLTDQERKLAAAVKLQSDSEAVARLVPSLREALDSAKRRAADTESELMDLKKKAEAAGLQLSDAKKQQQTIQVEVATLRKLLDEQRTASSQLKQRLTLAEARFAGVDLSGKRVVVLIDISGSMGAIDSNTFDNNKWPEVRRNVVLLLRSLPELEKFQVLVFSDQVRYLMGQPGQWLDYDRDKSPEEIGKALERTKTEGNTNLYTAFETAFRFRAQGLDSIYLISDGLPNVGPGLPSPPPQDEAAQAAALGRHVRETIRRQWNSGTSPVRIHAVGFFYESPNLGAFLWALTRDNGGSFVGMSKP
jgi:hypothetical protein